MTITDILRYAIFMPIGIVALFFWPLVLAGIAHAALNTASRDAFIFGLWLNGALLSFMLIAKEIF